MAHAIGGNIYLAMISTTSDRAGHGETGKNSNFIAVIVEHEPQTVVERMVAMPKGIPLRPNIHGHKLPVQPLFLNQWA